MKKLSVFVSMATAHTADLHIVISHYPQSTICILTLFISQSHPEKEKKKKDRHAVITVFLWRTDVCYSIFIYIFFLWLIDSVLASKTQAIREIKCQFSQEKLICRN